MRPGPWAADPAEGAQRRHPGNRTAPEATQSRPAGRVEAEARTRVPELRSALRRRLWPLYGVRVDESACRGHDVRGAGVVSQCESAFPSTNPTIDEALANASWATRLGHGLGHSCPGTVAEEGGERQAASELASCRAEGTGVVRRGATSVTPAFLHRPVDVAALRDRDELQAPTLQPHPARRSQRRVGSADFTPTCLRSAHRTSGWAGLSRGRVPARPPRRRSLRCSRILQRAWPPARGRAVERHRFLPELTP